MENSGIIGWGVDASVVKRPGVPEERHPPQPLVDIGEEGLPQQTTGAPSVKSRFRSITPIYSTATPPRGLSGILRLRAYQIPDYEPRRWLLLLLADRVDVLENDPVRLGFALALGLGAIVGGAVGLWRVAARGRRQRRFVTLFQR